MQYIRTNHMGRDTIYSVYNSRGDLMLYTRDQRAALRIARAFQDNPTTTEVVVKESDTGIPKRV